MNSIMFSIIIPIKGRFTYVSQAINSVYRQKNIKEDDIEILIVEDKLGKKIFPRLKKLFPKLIQVTNINESSPAGSRNAGLTKSRGQFIVFLDSDDKLKPEFLSKMHRILMADNKCSAVVCFSEAVFDGPYRLSKRIKLCLLMLMRDLCLLFSYIFNNKHLFPSAFYLCQISHMMFRTEKITEQKFSYTYSRGGEDWDYFNRCQNKGPIRIIMQNLLFFRYALNSSTNLPINLKEKWGSYKILAANLSAERKKGFFYKLFLYYIDLFN